MATVRRRHSTRKSEALRTTGGDLLTDEMIEALADEAEAGYALDQARVLHVGRPSLGAGISPRISMRTSYALYEATRQRARREGRSLSEVAREALERYVASGDS